MSTLMCFMLYKNIFMSLTMYWFNFFSGFSNAKFFTEAGIQFYNLFYTSLPAVLYAIGDQDIQPELVFNFPQIYGFNVRDDYFNVSDVTSSSISNPSNVLPIPCYFDVVPSSVALDPPCLR
jgi:phospholipid-translocating ATPase